MNISERAELYRKAFPNFQPLSVVKTKDKGERLEGLWIMGNDYQVKSTYYGGYPAGYVDRVMSMFPDCGNILHLFAGKAQKTRPCEVTFDSNPALTPDICGEAENLAQEIEGSNFEFSIEHGIWLCKKCREPRTKRCDCSKFDLILADPPYSDMIQRNTVVKECFKVLRPGGFLVWLDQVFPMFRKAETPLVGSIYVREEFPELEQVAEIGMIKSTNHRVRAIFIFQKKG